jgi:hypothetical protein
MSYNATVVLKFNSKWTPSSYSYVTDETMLPEEHVTMEAPAHDLTTTQYFRLFRNFLLAIGMDEANIMKGAVSLAFSEEQPYERMRRIAEEFDLVLNEDVAERVKEGVQKEKEIDEEWARIQNNSDKIDALTKENFELKAKLSRLENPDYEGYTEEEIAAMCYENK